METNNHLSRSARRIQSEARRRIPLETVLVLEHFVPDFTNFMVLHFLVIIWKIFQEGFQKQYKMF